MNAENVRSDLDIRIELSGGMVDDFAGWVDTDFVLSLTSGAPRPYGQRVTAWHIGDEWVNCEADGMTLRVIKGDHRLQPGELWAELEWRVPDASYERGYRKKVMSWSTGIKLTPYGVVGDTMAVTEVNAALVVKTAYDLAVAQGYAGSSEEYMGALANVADDLNSAAASARAAAQAQEWATSAAAQAQEWATAAEASAMLAADGQLAAERAALSAEAAGQSAAAAAESASAAEQSTNRVDELSATIEEMRKVLYSYGIEFDTTISAPEVLRIGNADLHRTLPVQSKMRGCLLDDDGNVVEYLPESDWTTAVRDGSMGQVMVEIPEHYRRFETEGNKRRALISEVPLQGYHRVPRAYVSAYQATVDRTVSATPKLASVANLTAAFRGGNNNSALDGAYNSMLGKPATYISRTNFRNYARNRKAGSFEWNCMTYDIQKTLHWLFVVEYATLNSQEAFNAALTAEGYHQGGLGAGVSNMPTEWAGYNSYYPLVDCGVTDALGNLSGVVTVHIENDDSSISKDLSVPRYRGVENPFAHIWQWTDGINVRISPTEENGGDGLSKVFVCSDPRLFKDNGYDGYSHVGNEARNDGHVKEIIFGEGGEIMPSVCTGGGSTTYFCDYHHTNIPTAEALRGVLFGGSANYGAACGFAAARSTNAPSGTITYFGTRLCFLPENSTNN